MTANVVAIISAILAIVLIFVKYWWKLRKESPKKPRLTYVEKKRAEIKRKIERDILDGDIPALTIDSLDVTDRIHKLHQKDTIDSNPGLKTDNDSGKK